MSERSCSASLDGYDPCTMRPTLKSLGIYRLDAQDRLALAEEIRESLEDEARPEDLVPWERVKAERLARLRM